MRRGQFLVLLLAMVVSGLAGGASVGLLTGSRVEAKEQIDMQADSMTARMFRLVDQKGNLRAALGSNKDGVPGLVMLDDKGRHRAYFNITEKGPGLELLGPDGSVRIALSVDDNGEPSLYLLNQGSKGGVGLTVSGEGGPRLGMMDNGGGLRLLLTVDKRNAPALLLGTGKGNPEAALTIHQGYGPGLFLQEASGAPKIAFTGQGAVNPAKGEAGFGEAFRSR